MKKVWKQILAWTLSAVMLTGTAGFAEDSAEEAAPAREWEEIRYGEPVSYGTTLEAAYIERSLTTMEDGRPVTLVSVSGVSNAITQIIDINAEKIIHTFYLKHTGYTYYGTVTPEGVIYYQVGKEIYCYDPRTKQEPEWICTAPTTRSGGMGGIVWDEDTKRLYATTSNTGNLFTVDPKVKEVKVLASLAQPGGGLPRPDVLGDYVYVNGKDKNDNYATHLYRVNKKTGEAEIIPDPPGVTPENSSYVYTGGKYVFTVLNGTCYIWDTADKHWEDVTFRYKTSGMTDLHDGKIFFLWNDCFHSIDVETLEIEDFPNLTYGSHLRGNGMFVELEDPELPGYNFLTAQYNGNVYVLNPQTQKMKHLNITLTGSPLEHRISRVGCDDKVYVMGFKGSNSMALDPETGEKKAISGGQGEGFVFDPATGKGYSGNYSGAFFYEMDTTRPYVTVGNDTSAEANPRYMGAIPDNQDRPFGMDIIDSRYLIVGTLSKAGTTEGALSIWDLETNELDVYKNIIPTHSLLTVTHKGHTIYAGTTVTGGSGSQPKETTAHIFSFDLDTRKIIKDIPIKIKGINGNIVGVHGLKIGPDGMLYGAVAGCDFVMDPDTLEIVRQNIYSDNFEFNSSVNSQCWHEYYMQFDPQTGYLFRTGDIINPETLEIVAKKPVSGQFAGLDSKGNAYFAMWNTEILKVPVIRGDDKSYLMQGYTFFKTGDDHLYQNGEAKEFSSYEDHGRIMVPARNMAKAMGGSVDYNEETKTAILTNAAGDTLSFVMNDNKVTFGNEVKKFGVTMKLSNGISYIPLQTLCDFYRKEVQEISGIEFLTDPGTELSVSEETINYILSEVYYEEQ